MELNGKLVNFFSFRTGSKSLVGEIKALKGGCFY